MKTLALSMIVRNEEQNLDQFLTAHKHHFDKVYILDTGSTDRTIEIAKSHGAVVHEKRFDLKPTKKQLEEMQWILETVPDDVTIFDFSAARNYAFSKIKEDYVVWLDADDSVDLGPRPYREVIQDIDPTFDGFFWGYDYAQNDAGESHAMHWRERLVRLKPYNLKWKGLIHETLIPKEHGYEAVWADDKTIIVKHHKSQDEHEGSFTRNIHTLLYEYARDGEQTDPRTLQYLGQTLIHAKKYRHAIYFLTRHIEKTGWDEDKYRSWRHIGECYRQMGDYERAIFCEQQALNVHGDIKNGHSFSGTRWPDAWYGMAEAHLRLGNYDMALDYVEIGLTKKPPDTLSVVDPTLYTYKPIAIAMKAYMGLMDVPNAYKAALKLRQMAPEFEMTREYYPQIRDVYFEGEYLKQVQWLLEYLQNYDPSKIESLLKSIPSELQFDPRVTKLKQKYIPPRRHGDDEVAFICGGVEKWTPKNVDKGIGGSEEAIIYLTRELAKLGWKVTVYNPCADDAGEYDGVVYKDVSEFNPADEFNVFVAWRMPFFFVQTHIKARKKLVDLHDAPVGHQDIGPNFIESVDKFMFKSQFQRNIGKHIPDDKVAVIPNGIDVSQFSEDIERNPHRVIWASSYDRGIGNLLVAWPKVKEAVPDAELDIYYGWNTFDTFFSNNPEQMKWKWQTIRAIHDVGAKEHGRVSHQELAKAMLGSGVWAYPTHFPEISCITAMKAQAAGMTPVTSGYAALQETVMLDEEDVTNDGKTHLHEHPELLRAYADRLIEALKNPESEEERRSRAQIVMDKYDWKNVAKQWDEVMR